MESLLCGLVSLCFVFLGDQPKQAKVLQTRLDEIGALDFGPLSKTQNSFDREVRDRFYEVFSNELTGVGVLSFLRKRIHYVVTGEQFTVRNAKHQNSRRPYDLPVSAAANLGLPLWIESLHLGAAYQFESAPEQWTTVSSPNIGISYFGDEFFTYSQLKQFAILVHEARHSDCTGGVSDEDKALLLRNDLPFTETLDQFAATSRCGHFHAKCPAHHPLAGEYACDLEPWGAYGIAAVFLDGMAANVAQGAGAGGRSSSDDALAAQSRNQQAQLTLMALDAYSRLVGVDLKQMRSGKLGKME